MISYLYTDDICLLWNAHALLSSLNFLLFHLIFSISLILAAHRESLQETAVSEYLKREEKQKDIDGGERKKERERGKERDELKEEKHGDYNDTAYEGKEAGSDARRIRSDSRDSQHDVVPLDTLRDKDKQWDTERVSVSPR